jgi:hypothetical protein
MWEKYFNEEVQWVRVALHCAKKTILNMLILNATKKDNESEKMI